jgi:hypothetical protein
VGGREEHGLQTHANPDNKTLTFHTIHEKQQTSTTKMKNKN